MERHVTIKTEITMMAVVLHVLLKQAILVITLICLQIVLQDVEMED